MSTTTPPAKKTFPWAWVFYLIFFLGVSYTIGLCFIRQSETFFSSDGGLKLTMARQIAAGESGVVLGQIGPDWVQPLYQKAPSYFPYYSPFVYDIQAVKYTCFPMWFSLLTAPLDALGGYDATFIIPLVGAWACWLVWLTTARRLGGGGWSMALGLFWLVAGSFLSIYAATYWEHTLAVCLAFAGVCLWLLAIQRSAQDVGQSHSPDRVRRTALLAGLLLGLSVWFRPELVGLCVGVGVVCLIHRDRSRTGLPLWIGLIVMAAGFIMTNWWFTGYPQGVHAKGTLDVFWSDRIYDAIRAFIHVPVYAPEIVLGLLLALFARVQMWIDRQSPLWLLSVAAVISLVVTVPITPHSGGMQWGPRYYLVFSPIGALLVALLLPLFVQHARSVWVASIWIAPTLALAAFGVYNNAWGGARALDNTQNQRVLPLRAFLLESKSQIPIVVDNQDPILEQMQLVRDRPLFRAARLNESAELMQFLKDHGNDCFIYISTLADSIDGSTMRFQAGNWLIEAQPRLVVENHYAVFICRFNGPVTGP